MKFEEKIKKIVFEDSELNKSWVEKYQEKFNQGFTLPVEIFELLDRSRLIQSERLCIKTDEIYEITIAAMFCKAFKTYQCIMLNLWKGYCLEAENLTRSMFELLVNVLFISQKQQKRRSRRYLEYKYVEDIKLMRGFDIHLEKIYSRLKGADKDKKWQDYESQFKYKKRKFMYKDKKRGKWKFLAQWSKESFGVKCREVGLPNYKDILYHQFSSSEHSGPSAVYQHLKEIKGIRKIYNFLPEAYNIEILIAENVKCLTMIFFVFVSVFNISLSSSAQLCSAYEKINDNIDFKICFKNNKCLKEDKA